MPHPVTPCQFCGKRSFSTPRYRGRFICEEHREELEAGQQERLRRLNGGDVAGDEHTLAELEEIARQYHARRHEFGLPSHVLPPPVVRSAIAQAESDAIAAAYHARRAARAAAEAPAPVPAAAETSAPARAPKKAAKKVAKTPAKKPTKPTPRKRR